ncbi:hypothetical protein MMC30_004445 [Trapelia coarctata]|nr:hypothetical protein [Trapelia coarctata]
MSANVLADKDINTSAPTTTKSSDEGVKDMKSMEHHRQVLQSRLAEDGEKTTYISPSDMMMSPTTAKLADMRNKRFAKAKPQALFGKNGSSNGTALFSSHLFPAKPVPQSDSLPKQGDVADLGEDMETTEKKEGAMDETA